MNKDKINGIVETMLEKEFPENHTLAVKFKNQNDFANERLAEINKLINSGKKHHIVIAQYWSDCGGFPYGEITTFTYEYNGKSYQKVKSSDSEHSFNCVDELY